ncbi:MAG: hypothetical protein HYR91_01190 [Flavobacteriia bacterium]|nr:hypothetical protein [Flavobacteriia bacterium]
MTVGTYWYSEFPSKLYNFEYFKFIGGGFGYAEIEAKLVTTIEVNKPYKIISRLKELINSHNEVTLFVFEGDSQMKIGIESYTLFDYHFLFITEIEKMLREENIKIVNIENDDYKYPKFFFLYDETYQKKKNKWTPSILKLERNNLKNNNGFNIKFRLDCNLSVNHKIAFINEIKTICREHGIEALYFFEKIINQSSNLMILITNGRQGLKLLPTNDINTDLLQSQISFIMKKYNVEIGYSEEITLYQNIEPIIELMGEQEFII